MKKTLLSAFITLAGATAFAQPTLNGTDINPVPTEVYYGHQADTTGAVVGGPGGPMTWNFSSVVEGGLDTTTYVTCISTPYCDSFAGSNLASFDNTNYTYISGNSSRLSFIGAYSGGSYVHITGNYDLLVYPFTYNLTHLDTFSASFSFLGINFYHYEVDSLIYDAYGTITTPGGTYTNAVRAHRFALSTDTSLFMGTTTGMVETYSWYVSGFHNPVFVYTADTSGGFYTEYYTQNISLGVNNKATAGLDLQSYPNPATDVINLSFNLPGDATATVSLCDLTGRTITTIGNEKMKTGANEFSLPVAGLPDGMYLIRLQSSAGSITRKVVVSR